MAETSSLSRIYASAGLLDEASAPPKRPNRRGELTRERLVAAAAACFAEYGYNRTRIADITHRAATSQGNFYRHFAGLDEIFLEVLRPGLAELAEASGRTGRSAPTLESLIEVSTAYLHAYTRHRATLRLLREAAATSPNGGFQRLWLGLRAQFVRRTERWLQRLADDGTIAADGDLHLLAESLGCLTEQMAYVHVGLAATAPRREQVADLGRAVGEVWFRALPMRTEAHDGPA